MNHLAIYNKKLFNKDYIVYMLDGSRKIGLKFCSKRTAPYGKIKTGDVIYLKEPSGPLRGRVTVGEVVNYVIEDSEGITNFLVDKMHEISIDNEVSYTKYGNVILIRSIFVIGH